MTASARAVLDGGEGMPRYSDAPPWVPQPDALLAVSSLGVAIGRGRGEMTTVIDGATFDLEEHGAMGIVGESGSGKSMLSRAIVGTIDRYGGRIVAGSLRLAGEDVADFRPRDWRRVRAKTVGFVPQSSMAGLNPVLSVGSQLGEVFASSRIGRGERRAKVVELLDMVRIARPERIIDEMPAQLSGGMRQRVVIAAALARFPRLLVLDEPTTALDATVQAEILRLINELRSELGTAILITSHDMAVIESVCERVMTMYAGTVVEIGRAAALAMRAHHPYTRALALSRVDDAIPGQDIRTIPGEPPTAGSWPSGCRFRDRCLSAKEACAEGGQPALRTFGEDVATACIRTGDTK